MAFDFDDKPSTIAYVNRALDRFAAKIGDVSSSVSKLKWTGSKGIDDLIVAKGVKYLDRIYKKRMEVKPIEEKSEKKPTAWQLSPKIALDVYGGTMRYDVEFKQYWEYNNGLWKQCADEYIFALVKTYLDTVTEDYPTRLVTETITFARGSILIPEWIEADNTKFIPFKNGVLEVETMQLLSHSPSYGFRWQMPRDYSVVSTGWSNIDRFLNEFSKENTQLKNILLAFCNATLMGRSNLHKFLYLAGSGGNGKGVFMSLLQSLVGVENTHTTSLASLCENRFEPANIKNKRLVLCDDEDKKPDSLTVFKSATGGGDITCEYKGKQSVNFKFGGIFVIAANQAIFKGENHEAMKRRKVDFPCMFKPIKKDEELIDRLILELPSFTTYVLSLDPDWVKRTIRESSSVEAVAILARETSILEDSVAAFFHHRLVFDGESKVQSSSMYKDYESYCADNNLKPLGGNKFPKMLLEFCNDSMKLGVIKKEGRSCNSFIGLRFATFADDEASNQGRGGKIDECGGKSGGNCGSQEPVLRKSVEGVEANSPISYAGKTEENNININTRSEGMIGVFASTPSTEQPKPSPSDNSSSVEAKAIISTPSTPIKIGDRVKNTPLNKSGVVERISRHPKHPRISGMWARVIQDDRSEWWAEYDYLEKIE
jgi:putative DNA primase/helicase